MALLIAPLGQPISQRRFSEGHLASPYKLLLVATKVHHVRECSANSGDVIPSDLIDGRPNMFRIIGGVSEQGLRIRKDGPAFEKELKSFCFPAANTIEFQIEGAASNMPVADIAPVGFVAPFRRQHERSAFKQLG